MGRDLLPVFYAIMNWGFRYEDILYKNEKEE
jgi:DNA-binding HxlR family transcriptional regulator